MDPLIFPFLYPCRPWLKDCGAASSSSLELTATPKRNSGKALVAGGITGGIEICVTYPTDYIKTQLQLDEKGDKKKYDGISDVVRKTVKLHGPFGLYRGLSVVLYGCVPKTGVRFGSYETFESYLKKPDGTISHGKSMLCGLGAGISEALLAVIPMETIRVKFVNDHRSPTPKYKGLFHGIRAILSEEGLSGIYQGVLPTTIKHGSNQATRFFIMETLKDAYRDGVPDVHIPKLLIGAMGSFAGLCSVVANNPIDVIKTRMQGLEGKKYKGTLDCAMQIFNNEGPWAFYKGITPRLASVCVDVAITFMLYDSFMELFNKFW